MPTTRTSLVIGLAVAGTLAICVGPATAAAGDLPVPPLPAATPASSAATTRTASLPARGLFVGDQLSTAARERLSELIIDIIGRQVEVALVVPTGPWHLETQGRDERDLTPARLASVRRFLTERGVDPQRIYVESRTDEKIKEPRLDVQIVARPGAGH